MSSQLDKARFITIPTVTDNRGSLSFAEGNRHIPFDIKRIFYIYDIPSYVERGNHAHRTSNRMIVAAKGSVKIILSDGEKEKSFLLDDPAKGLVLPPMVWESMSEFTDGTLLIVVADDCFSESDYIRSYGEFMRIQESVSEKSPVS